MVRIATILGLAALLSLPLLPARADDRPGVTLEGTIEATAQAQLTLHGVTFHVTALTRILNTVAQPIPFSQLAVGQRVEVEGMLAADGRFYAYSIKQITPEDRPDRVQARGRITALSADSLTIHGFTFRLTAETEVEGTLAVGLYAEVEGEVREGQFVALQVEGSAGDQDADRFPTIELKGPILALQDSVLVVQGLRIWVTAATRIHADDQLLTLADLVVGMLVEVEAHLSRDGQLTAIEIEVASEDRITVSRQEIELKGFIQALSDSTLTVGGLTFWVTPLTQIYDDEDQPLSFAALEVGQFVEVKGYFDLRQRLLLALEIEVKTLGEHMFEFAGPIEAVGTDSLVVAGLTFWVSSTTTIEDAWGRSLMLSDLQVGMLVKVKAERQRDGTWLALKIKVLKAFHPVVDVRGPIEALTDSTLTVSGLVFHARPGVFVIDAQGQQVHLNDLQLGMVVKVRGVAHPDGTYWAMRIHVLTDENDQEVEIEGTIEAIGTDSLVVAGVPVFVDANTQILTEDSMTITFGELQTGQIVEVKATMHTGLGLVAQQIKIESLVAATGRADTLRADAVVVGSVTFAITSQTVVVDAQQQPIAWADVQAGQQVIVYGRRSASVAKTGNGIHSTTYTADYVTVLDATAITTTASERLPAGAALDPAYPNPFTQRTTLRFTLGGTAPQPVTLEIYNLLGQRVRTLVHTTLPPGVHEVIWNATDEAGRPVASGMYLYRLQVGRQALTRTLTLVR